MKMKSALCCGVAAIVSASSANAATITLVDQGFAGNAAVQAQFRSGFQTAANYWGSILSSNVNIRLGVGTAALATGIIGSTGSNRNDVLTAAWETAVNVTKSNSAIDTNIVLPTLTTGGASFITNGVKASALAPTATTPNPVVDDLTTQRYVNGSTTSAQTLYLNSSVTKAIGLAPVYSGTFAAQQLDGSVRFSTNFNFDFNPTDGINANTFDFIGVAIHEIGHALGFVSGVDFLDIYGSGPGTSANEDTLGYSLNDTSIYSALDMFRYSTDPNNLAPGTNPALDLAVGGTKYFSIDGGATALFGNTFSTGSFNGDGRQASHWKDNMGLGILDPTFAFGEMGMVTGLDLAAYDAMGWNLSTNALTYGVVSTSSIYRQFNVDAVPESATWLMMIAGFGAVGVAMRRRPAQVAANA